MLPVRGVDRHTHRAGMAAPPGNAALVRPDHEGSCNKSGEHAPGSHHEVGTGHQAGVDAGQRRHIPRGAEVFVKCQVEQAGNETPRGKAAPEGGGRLVTEVVWRWHSAQSYREDW